MVARAEVKYIRISPQKIRLVTNLLKGMPVQKAAAVLKSLNKKGAYYLGKILHSAVSNAKNKGFKEDTLFISRTIANPGPTLKRYQAASFGRAGVIRKRTSHVSVELDTEEKIINTVSSVKKRGRSLKSSI